MTPLAVTRGCDKLAKWNWSAQQYALFEAERTRPVRDLLAQVPTRAAKAVVDIGCGPGNSTELLAAQFPNAAVLALDSSPDMITAAQKRLPHIATALVDIATWDAPGPFDVILGNAVLQWLPEHAALLPRLVAKLTDGGSLAIQIPDNLDEPAQTAMVEVAQNGPWAQKLSTARAARAPRHDAAFYYDTLRPHCTRVELWRTTYQHPLASAHAVVEWFRGTGLLPFLAPLDANERGEFLTRYERAITAAYPAAVDGRVLLPFPRLFFVATR